MAAQPKPARRTALVATRKAAGFTQESLAAKVGVERTTVFRWESGETVPTPWSRPGLAALLGISNDQLTRLLGEPTADTATSTAPSDDSAAQPPEPTTATHHAATGLSPALSDDQAAATSLHLPATAAGPAPTALIDADVALWWAPAATVEIVSRFMRKDLTLERREATHMLAGMIVGSALLEPLERWLSGATEKSRQGSDQSR